MRHYQWSVLITIACAFFLLRFGLVRPAYNWDMIGYVAAAYQQDGLIGEDLHSQTYLDVKQQVGKDVFEGLLQGPYRSEVYRSTTSLQQQIPFYSIRILYIETMRGLRRLGVPNYSRASSVVSAVSAALAVIVVGAIFKKLNLSPWGVPLVTLSLGYLGVATQSTPDALACLISLLCLLLAINKNPLVLFFSIILPAARTDFIVLSVMFLFGEYRKNRKKTSIAALTLSVTLFYSINKLCGNYGWLTIFNFTFINMSPYPADMAFSSRLQEYAVHYLDAALQLFSSPHFVVYALAGYLVRFKLLKSEYGFELFFIPIFFVAGHLLAFPSYSDRFFVFSATAVLIGIFCFIDENWKKSDKIA